LKDSHPEEKLLNLIKKGKKIEAPRDNNIGITLPKEKPLEFAEKEGLSSAPFLDLNNIFKLEGIRKLNIALFIALIVIILYLFLDIFLIPSTDPDLFAESKVLKGNGAAKEIEIKPYSYYSEKLRQEVFKPFVREREVAFKPEIPIEELMANLALLGIVSGDSPQAIIEDKAQRKSFFLREGQSSSGVFLKKIEEDSVTVIYKGEEFSLTM